MGRAVWRTNAVRLTSGESLVHGWMIATVAPTVVLTVALTLLLVACRETGAPPVVTMSQTARAGAVRPVVTGPAVQVADRDGEALSDEALIAFGANLYATNCASCHQPNGEGNLGQFPALNRNAFVTVSDPTAVIQTVLYGRQIMPAFAPALTPLEVAAVISYVRNAWDNQAATVTVEQVRSVQEAQRAQSAASNE